MTDTTPYSPAFLAGWDDARGLRDATIADEFGAGVDAASMTTPGEWALDTSTGRVILVKGGCSVIEEDDARFVLGLIAEAARTDRQQMDGGFEAGVRAAVEKSLRKAALAIVSFPGGTVMHSPPQLLTEASDKIIGMIPELMNAALLPPATDPLREAAPDVENLMVQMQNLLMVYSQPDEQLCCGGRECGCMGATNSNMLKWHSVAEIGELIGSVSAHLAATMRARSATDQITGAQEGA